MASSDATNVQMRIERDGDDYVLNGRKWWTTGAIRERCRILIVMGKTDPDGPPHRQQSMVLVPRDTPGVTVLRNLTVFGYSHNEGHGDVLFEDVRVPVVQPASPGRATASSSARRGSARGASTTACARSARRSARSS